MFRRLCQLKVVMRRQESKHDNRMMLQENEALQVRQRT
jgi:hypothetical protein